MTVTVLIQRARADGVILAKSRVGTILATGEKERVKRWVPIIRDKKQQILAALSESKGDTGRLVSTLMETGGLSWVDAEAISAYASPKSSADWLSMIGELDQLIAEYCALTNFFDKDKKNLLAVRYIKASSTIPATMKWFRYQIRIMRSAK
jgi:hypothetical protein